MAAMAAMRASQRQMITKTVAASTAFPRITSTSTIPSSARLHNCRVTAARCSWAYFSAMSFW
eukprot:2302773-Rhodomonas_salina.1